MFLKTYQKPIGIILSFIVIAIISSVAYAQTTEEENPIFGAAIEQIEAAGEYSFVAQIEQTMIPRPIPINVGKAEERIDSVMSGQVVLPDFAQINLQFESGGNLPPITIEQDGSAVYLIEGEERTQIENPLSVSPTTDFLAYVESADNVRQIENPDQPHLTVYQFDINGQAFGEALAKSLREQLPPEQKGVPINIPDQIANMSGQGELWLDGDGYPQRQILEIFSPEASETFDAQSRIVIDYAYETQLAGVDLPTADNLAQVNPAFVAHDTAPDGSVSAATAEDKVAHALGFGTLALVLLGLALLIILAAVVFNHLRWVRVAIPIGLVIVMLGAPILQPIAYAHAADKHRTAADLPSLTEALGIEAARDHAEAEAEAAASADAAPDQVEAQPASLQAQAAANNPNACGTGSTTADTDLDGTSDFVEKCLGTNPFSIDTDLDGITDTLEINGFVFTDTQNITHAIYTNPLELDSNSDGLDDFIESPSPIGLAPSIDPDGDNLPNHWDPDNDGDGVNDDVDIDPFTKSDYQPNFSIRTGLNGSNYDGFQYIEFQVQPQDQSRFQLLTTELDWPYDDEGTIQARNAARQDEITFAPMLKIETNVVPDVFRRAYGVTLIQQGGKDYMYVDLAPVSENGQITAFYGKVAYRQSDLNDINWSKVELVWTAFMKHSPASDPSNTGYLTIPVAEYIEPSFRFAGLEVSKSSTTKYAVIGTPNAQTDHRQLVNLVAGLEGSFLSSFSSDFDTIVNRLSTPTTSITDTWGVPVSEIAVGLPTVQPAHEDLALLAPLDTNSTITQFLATNRYDTAQSASLIMAIEGLSGTDGLDGEAVISGNTFTFNLAQIPLYTTRTMTLSHYEHNGTRWTDEDELAALNRLVANYPGDPAAAVTTLQQSYPEITEYELATMLLAFYMLWINGRSATVSVDGVDIIGEAETAQELQNRVGLPAITDTLVYLIEAYNMGDPLGSVIWKDFQTYSQFIDDPVSTKGGAVTSLSAFTLILVLKISLMTFQAAKGKLTIGFRSTKLIGTAFSKISNWLLGAKYYASYQGVTVGAIKPGLLGLGLAKTTARIAKYAKLIGKIARVASAAAAAVSITTAWVTYANFSSPYEYERQYAAVYAGVATFLAIVYFVLALTGIGTLLVAIFTLIDIIGWIASSASKYEPVESVITTAFAKLILDVDALTEPYDTSYRGLDALVDGNGYTVAGSTLTLIDRFFGSIKGYTNHYDSNGQHPYLNSSDIYSIFEARAANNITVVPGHDATNRSNRCEIVNALKICANNLWADFTFANDGLNQQVEVFYRITAVTQYSQRSLAGLINKTKTNTLNLPEELEGESWSWLPIKVDVLPNTLNGLLTWPAVTNHDDDGDDISDTIENGLTGVAADIDGDSVPNSQDWDRDGDGLGDGYETANQNALGTNPNLLDSDSDGLNDKVEIENGTLVNLADSDSDGLNDAVETYRWTGSQWTGGGWTINILGNDYWVFSDPDVSDADRDGIIDSSERANGTSPYAFNDAPEILLDAGPVVTTPSNSFGVYVKAGDTVTSSLKIFNTGTSAISDTLTYCLPSVLAGATLTVTGDVTPATQQSSGCYSWDFSSTNLGLFQRFNVDIAGSATSTTVNESISVSLPYAVNGAAQPISYTIPYVQDNSPPTVQITNPLSNTLLTSQFYVIGGFAQDSSSWIDRVEVTVPGTSGQAVLSDSAWAYTWQLPTDGPATVTATAYDALGNSSGPVSVPVTVDTLPPTLNVNIADRATIGSTTAFSPTLQLNGTATDNFSGVDRIQLQTNDRPWITVWDGTTNLLNTSWSGIWELPTVENAQGEHLLSLRAFDAYGNVTTITRTVFIDILPPTNGLTNQAFVQETPNHVPGGQTVPLYGVASDAGNNPLPADPIALSGSLDSISDATVWLGLDKLTDNDRGATVTWLGDMNGDRLGDLAVGLPGANGGRGKVIVVNGRPGNWPAPNAGEIEPLSTNSPSYLGGTGDQLGSIIHSAGDVNGDGLDDLLVGDPANNRITLVLGRQNNYIFEQPLDGSANNQIGIVTQASGESLSTLQATGVAGVGDVTNDGYGDLLVTVSTASGSRVYLLPGTISLINDQALDFHGAATLDTTSTNVSVAGVGDVNSDLIPDFAIAIDGTIHLFAGGGGWVQGGLTPLNTSAAIATYSSSDSVPTIVAAGDINGDRIADFAFTNGSTPTIVFGNASQSFTTQSLSGFASPLSGFLAAVGDVNKDGRGDLLVGNSNGDAYLISGSNLSAAAATISGVTAAASTPFITAADLAGDGSSDLALVPSAANITGLGFNGFANLETQAPFISTSALKQINGGAQITTTAQSPMLEPGDVTVGLVGANYTSIQAAIDSGATRVLVQPGIYSEAITLTAGVTIIGSGPDRTVLQFPTGSSASSLVTANNVANAAVQNMTLLGSGSGSGSQTGLAVSNGATGIGLERTVIQNMNTAVSVSGSTTTLALRNNTLVSNVNGFVASSNAGVDVRNTILAYNTGTALQYDNGAVLKLHQYNLYFANGTDLSPNNPGGGEIFSDPLFLDYANGDYRTVSFSPVIDAGTPNSPVPPGSGRAIDIGHLEQSGSSFFTDDNYCATCVNDGLIWGVNAFSTIQAAVNAAQEDIANLQLETPIQFNVGVNDGIYNESVVISTSVNLLGQGPDRTSIVGSTGPAVTYQAAVNGGVNGFKLRGGGASPIGILLKGGSNTIDINYNYIISNTVGISVTERSSGNATFNTISGNTTGVSTARGTYWNTVAILDNAGNQIGTTRTMADTCTSTILCEERGFVWLDLTNSIVSGNGTGLAATGKSVIFSQNNLLFNTTNYTNVPSGTADLIGQDPLLAGPHGYLQTGSPALDRASFKVRIPVGGGLEADLGWHELLATPISILMGQPDESLATESIGVSSVEYAVVPVADPTLPFTATLPSSWSNATLQSPGQKLSYWQVNYTPAGDGLYRLYSRAADSLGNAETNVNDWYDGAFVVDSNAPVVTMTIQTYTVNNWRLLEAEVLDYIGTSFDVDDIYFTIDGERIDGRWKVEQWAPDGRTPRTFSYLFQNNTGQNISNAQIQAVAVDGAGNIGRSPIQTIGITGDGSNQSVDTIPPSIITVTEPIAGSFISRTVTFKGVVGDLAPASAPANEIDSRTNGVELSFDGGITWNAARLIPLAINDPLLTLVDFRWEYTWTAPAGLDATTIPVRVRATDYAGNFRSEITTVSIDTAPPRSFNPNFNFPEGSFTDGDTGQVVVGTYTAPLDGSGWVTATRVIENPDGSVQLFQTPGGFRITVDSNEGAALNATRGVRDEMNNVIYNTYGTWYVGDVAVGPDWRGFQALNRDGLMEINRSEWLTTTEFLDDDERPARTQSLWVSWDSVSSFIGWQGSSWGPDGELWAYYDLVPGGATVAIEGGHQLPFEADFAVNVLNATTAVNYQYNVGTSTWSTQTLNTVNINPNAIIEYGHNSGRGESEIDVYFRGFNPGIDSSWNRMFAYASDPSGTVYSAFPTVNALDQSFSYFYEWPKTTDPLYLRTLPQAARQPSLGLAFTSTPAEQESVTASDTITYAAAITNLEGDAESGIQLLLSGSNGLSYQTITGASSSNCPTPTSCTINLPTIPAGGTQIVTITANTAANLTGINQVGTTPQLQAQLPIPLANLAITHTVDITAPIVTIDTIPGNVASSGVQVVSGTASDGDGAGLASVEVSTDGVTWQLATGTQEWRAAVPAPAGPTWQLYARATDNHQQVSQVVTQAFVLDTLAPLITPTVPSLVGGSSVAQLTGEIRDLGPAGAEVESVGVQFDSPFAPTRDATVFKRTDGTQGFFYTWALPAEDAVQHTVRFQAVDYAGNLTTTAFANVIVDTVAPRVVITSNTGSAPVGGTTLSGTIADGSPISSFTVSYYPPVGPRVFDTITPVNGSWSYTSGQPAGSYSMMLQATDAAGNERLLGPIQVTIGQGGVMTSTGDVSCDTNVNTVDGLFILQFNVGLRNSTAACPLTDTTTQLNTAVCDVSGDGSCNTVDALFILQCNVGINNAFCPAP